MIIEGFEAIINQRWGYPLNALLPNHFNSIYNILQLYYYHRLHTTSFSCFFAKYISKTCCGYLSPSRLALSATSYLYPITHLWARVTLDRELPRYLAKSARLLVPFVPTKLAIVPPVDLPPFWQACKYYAKRPTECFTYILLRSEPVLLHTDTVRQVKKGSWKQKVQKMQQFSQNRTYIQYKSIL